MNPVDGTRLEEFRQFRKEVRGSRGYLLVGIDVAKEKHYAFFLTAQGKTFLRLLVFDNNLEGFQRLLAQARALRHPNGLKRIVFGMEPTGN
jgi:transposase